MDFKISINDKTKIYSLYEGVYLFIGEQISQWNNFYPDEPLVIHLEKVPSEGETLGIKIKDKTQLDEKIS